MGREFIDLEHLSFPENCPRCGSRKFRVEGARRVHFTAVYEVDDKSAQHVEDEDVDLEWEVAYWITCIEKSRLTCYAPPLYF